MTEDIDQLLSCIDRISRVYRLGSDKTKDNLREAIVEAEHQAMRVKRAMGKEPTRVIHHPGHRVDHAGE